MSFPPWAGCSPPLVAASLADLGCPLRSSLCPAGVHGPSCGHCSCRRSPHVAPASVSLITALSPHPQPHELGSLPGWWPLGEELAREYELSHIQNLVTAIPGVCLPAAPHCCPLLIPDLTSLVLCWRQISKSGAKETGTRERVARPSILQTPHRNGGQCLGPPHLSVERVSTACFPTNNRLPPNSCIIRVGHGMPLGVRLVLGTL